MAEGATDCAMSERGVCQCIEGRKYLAQRDGETSEEPGTGRLRGKPCAASGKIQQVQSKWVIVTLIN